MSPKKIMKWPQGRDTKCYALKISNILKVLSAFCMLPNLWDTRARMMSCLTDSNGLMFLCFQLFLVIITHSCYILESQTKI